MTCASMLWKEDAGANGLVKPKRLGKRTSAVAPVCSRREESGGSWMDAPICIGVMGMPSPSVKVVAVCNVGTSAARAIG